MADVTPSRDSNGNNADDAGTPRWVKVFGIIALLVILLFVILFFTRDSHGPGRHMRGDTSRTLYSQSRSHQS